MKTLLLGTAVIVFIAFLSGCSAFRRDFDSISVNAGAGFGKASVDIGLTGHLRPLDPKEIRAPRAKVAKGEWTRNPDGSWNERLWTADNRPIVPFSE